jgi:hypothetical protein
MPRLALNRKDTRWRIDRQQAPMIAMPTGFPASLA